MTTQTGSAHSSNASRGKEVSITTGSAGRLDVMTRTSDAPARGTIHRRMASIAIGLAILISAEWKLSVVSMYLAQTFSIHHQAALDTSAITVFLLAGLSAGFVMGRRDIVPLVTLEIVGFIVISLAMGMAGAETGWPAAAHNGVIGVTGLALMATAYVIGSRDRLTGE